MGLINREKLNFWGAVASIVGVPLAIVLYWATQPMTASSQSQPRTSVSTTGDRSPAIGSSGSDVIIHYNAPVKEKGYVLRNVKYGATLLVDPPDFAGMNDPKHHGCLAPAGTPVRPTGRKADTNQIKDYWREVTVIAGDCAGKDGWVASENLSGE